MFKNRMLNISMIIIVSMIVLAIIFFFLYQVTFPSALTKDKNNAIEKKSIDKILPLVVDIPKINTNLGDATIVSVELSLQASNSKTKEEIEKRMFQVKDRINLLLKNLTIDSINTEEKLVQFKSELKNRLNTILQEGTIEEIEITQLIYQ